MQMPSSRPGKKQCFWVYELGRLERAFVGNAVRILILYDFISDAKKLGSWISQNFPKVPEGTDSGRNQLYGRIRGLIGGRFVLRSTCMLYFKFSDHRFLCHSPRKFLVLSHLLSLLGYISKSLENVSTCVILFPICKGFVTGV